MKASEGNVTRADRVVIQRNPTSGSGRGSRELRALIRELRASGFRVRLFARRDQLDEFLSQADVRGSVRCLVAAGGDGTVASLAHRHAGFPIAVLPLGTENLVARYLQIPRCGRAVAEIIRKRHTREFDTAFVNEQRFLVMVSSGVDAEVVRQFSSVRTGNIRHWNYIRPILQSFVGYRFPQISVRDASGELLATGSHVIVTNIPEYGFRLPFCPAADPTDGLLDVRVLQRTGPVATALHVLRMKLGLSERSDEVTRFTVTEVQISAEADDVPIQFDGDPADNCPARIRIAPKSMTLLVRG